MSLISYKCSKCGAEIKTDESICGELGKCPSCGNESKVPIPGVYEGLHLAGFIIEKQLGVGGMGEVWLARHEKMGRHVAIKILSPKYTSNQYFVDRFMSEVRNSAKLEHPNIVTAFHAGEENGIYYLAISFVSGDTLMDILSKNGVFSEEESLRIAYAAAEALDYAWSEFRILHRDIKPSNIMIDKKGVPKIMDMGISKNLNEDGALTMAGTMVGTPYYTSPEQAVGAADIDFRSDIYSLGATLYHIVTGTVPFDATTVMAILSKQISEPLPDPRQYNAALSDQFVALVQIMMAKDKNDRQKSWNALIADIKKVSEKKYPETPVPDANKTIVSLMKSSPNDLPASEIREKEEGKKIVESVLPSAETKIKGKKQKFPFILLVLIICFLMALLSAGAGAAFFAYKWWKAHQERRTVPLPTEIAVKPTPEPEAEKPSVENIEPPKELVEKEVKTPAMQEEMPSIEKTPEPEKTQPPEPALEKLPSTPQKDKDSRARPNW